MSYGIGYYVAVVAVGAVFAGMLAFALATLVVT